METGKLILPENPREDANPLSRTFMLWTLPIFKQGCQKHLEMSDIYRTLQNDESHRLGDKLERHYLHEVEKCLLNEDKSNRKPSLAKALLKTFWREFIFLGVIVFTNEIFVRLATPVMLGKLLEYFQPDSQMEFDEAVWWAVGIVALTALSVIFTNHYMLGCFQMGMRGRIAVCSLIYRKSLKLSRTAIGDSSPGKIVNLLSNDVNRFDIVAVFLHYMWVAPVASLLALYFIFINVGVSGILGIAVVFTVMPLQAYAGKLSSIYRLKTALKTDERVRLMNEIISGVQVIKMYAWEKPFQKLITVARQLELKVIRKTSYVRAFYMSFLLLTTRMAIFCCMLLMYYLDEPITAAKMFVVAAYFNSLSSTISAMFVRAIAEVAEARVAIKRLETYLNYDEFIKTPPSNKYFKDDLNSKNLAEKYKANGASNKKDDDWADKKYSVKITKAECKWLQESLALNLNITGLEIPKGKLIGVIGPIGCGKSSLLQLILKELPMLSGTLEVDNSLSYACQEPWVFGASVRQNILFGQPYNHPRYSEVIKVCALIEDFAQFPQGDQTLIGERGTSLSGGQKARINLARAIYRDANIYLLDDPLSAVDAHVGRHLFQQCIVNFLKHKTRILVTHQLHHLREADYIVLLKDGKIELQGSYNDMINSSFEYTTLLTPIQEDKPLESAEGTPEKQLRERHQSMSKRFPHRQNSLTSQHTRSGSLSSSIMDLGEFPDNASDTQEEYSKEKPQVAEAEASSKGIIKGSLFMAYLKSGVNLFFLSLLFLIFVAAQGFASGADYWMSYWTKQEELRAFYEKNNISFAEESTTTLSENQTESDVSETDMIHELLSSETCITVYGSIIGIMIFCTFVRSISFYNVCLKASQKLHDKMFRGIIRSPLRFFFTNPSGRIMNRFSKDMGAVDELLPKAILDSSQMILQMVGAVVIACNVNYIFIIPISILFVVFVTVRKYFLKTSKSVKRLEGISRSPVFTHLNATLQGLSTIRAYGAEDILKKEFDNLQDTHTSTFFLFITTSAAFGLLLDILCLMLTTFITFTCLYMTGVLGNSVGLVITQTLSLTFLLQWGIRQSAEVANQLMAVERMFEYTLIPPEKGIAPDEFDLKDKSYLAQKPKELMKPNETWPDMGQVQFIDLYMKYSENADDVYVLKGLNCTIKPSEKVGIVGRTGAGKSSIISAMFRLAYNSGEIIVDNVNTENISVEDLRKKISIIPQDPVLFSGTLRRNLDPFEEYSDASIWQALDEVELKNAIDGPGGLESRVMDGGVNFSVGQRQLICLARAILRNNRLLMLDEATANVDPYTDNLIQKTIREKFLNCTVITIAHRLNTIMDSDRVLVMNNGNIAEFDHPYLLLKNEESFLCKMAHETGPQNFLLLHEMAKECYRHKFSLNTDEDLRMIDD